MKRKLIVFSLLGIICFPFFYSEPNFENKQVPGIVEGTAKMINTKIYFGNNQLKTAKVKIKIIANYTENLKIDIGYKPPTDPLMEEFTPIKKITIWERKNLFETESNYIHIS